MSFWAFIPISNIYGKFVCLISIAYGYEKHFHRNKINYKNLLSLIKYFAISNYFIVLDIILLKNHNLNFLSPNLSFSLSTVLTISLTEPRIHN